MLSKNEYVENLRRIYMAHDFYVNVSEGDKERIYDACETLFDRVESKYDSTGGSTAASPTMGGSTAASPTMGGSTAASPTMGGSIHDSGLDRSFGVLLLLFGDMFLEQQFGEDCSNFDEFVDKYIL